MPQFYLSMSFSHWHIVKTVFVFFFLLFPCKTTNSAYCFLHDYLSNSKTNSYTYIQTLPSYFLYYDLLMIQKFLLFLNSHLIAFSVNGNTSNWIIFLLYILLKPISEASNWWASFLTVSAIASSSSFSWTSKGRWSRMMSICWDTGNDRFLKIKEF